MVHLQIFNCPKCSRLFSSPTNVKRHSLICQGIKEKPEALDLTNEAGRTLPKKWRCLLCQKKLTTTAHVYRHFQILHPNEDPNTSTASVGSEETGEELVYKCEQCPETFPQRRQLRRHVGMVHLQIFNCPKCCRLFSSPTNAKRHSLNCQGIKEKPEGLDLSMSPGSLRTLMKRWQCLICKKKLTTIPHIYRHFQILHPNQDPKALTTSIGGDDSIKEEPVDEVEVAKERRRQRCQCNICGKTATRYFLNGLELMLMFIKFAQVKQSNLGNKLHTLLIF
jgi:uncharacterized Zn-finger protein